MEWIVVRFIVVERTIVEFRPLDVLHCGPSCCCLGPPRHTLPCILTHTDTTQWGNSFHDSSALTIYIRCEHFILLRHARASHLFNFALFFLGGTRDIGMGRTDHCTRFDDSCHARMGILQTLDISEMAGISFIEEVYLIFIISCC